MNLNKFESKEDNKQSNLYLPILFFRILPIFELLSVTLSL